MKLLTVSPRQGALWVKQGIQVFMRAPMSFCMLLVVTTLAALVFSPLRLVGMVLMLMTLPLISLGFMIATKRVLDGDRRLTPMVFVEPFRAGRAKARSLIKLCTAYAVLFIVILMVSTWVGGSHLDKLAPSPQGTIDLSVVAGDSRLMWAMFLCLSLIALLSLAFWHAPALIYWGGQGMSHALFSSTLACWRSRSAFTIYGLVLIALNIAASWALLLVLLLFNASSWLAPIMLAAGLLLSAIFYASLYFSFTDSFSMVDEDELVA